MILSWFNSMRKDNVDYWYNEQLMYLHNMYIFHRDIVDARPLAVLSFSPSKDKILFHKRRALPPLSDLVKPEEKLAGVRIDGHSNTRSRMQVLLHRNRYPQADGRWGFGSRERGPWIPRRSKH